MRTKPSECPAVRLPQHLGEKCCTTMLMHVTHITPYPLNQLNSPITQMSRQCLPSGQWGEVDFTGCTLRSGVSRPFTLYWTSLVDVAVQEYEVGKINVYIYTCTIVS